MEAALGDINAVLGVTGSFVCTADGNVAAQAMPASFDPAQLTVAARVASQTLNALETSGQRASEVDLSFGRGRMLLKGLRGGVLVILCAPTINLPLLNLTANLAAKKIAAEFKASKPPPAPRPVSVAPAAPHARTPAAAAAPAPAKVQVAPPDLIPELEQETYRIVFMGQQAQVVLRAIDPLGIWLCCPQTRQLLHPPEKRHVSFAARASQSLAIQRLFEQAGFESNQRLNAFYNYRRLHFAQPAHNLAVEVFLDAYDMYLHLDLASLLTQDDVSLTETPLCLMRLQLVEMPESALSELCALFFEHDLNTGPERGKIDAAHITDLCADDWGWYRTVTMNLDRVAAHAPKILSPVNQSLVLDRVQKLKKRIDGAPKSLRWQMRARVGDSMRWYEVPLAPGTAARPDLAVG